MTGLSHIYAIPNGQAIFRFILLITVNKHQHFIFVLRKNVDLIRPNTFYLNQAKEQLLTFHIAQDKAMGSVSVG